MNSNTIITPGTPSPSGVVLDTNGQPATIVPGGETNALVIDYESGSLGGIQYNRRFKPGQAYHSYQLDDDAILRMLKRSHERGYIRYHHKYPHIASCTDGGWLICLCCEEFYRPSYLNAEDCLTQEKLHNFVQAHKDCKKKERAGEAGCFTVAK